MDGMTIIIISCVILLLIFDGYFILRLRKKRQDRFKLFIEKGQVVEFNETVPEKFLEKVKTISQSHHIQQLFIYGYDLSSNAPYLEFQGSITPELKQLFQVALQASIQKTLEK